MRRLIFGIMMAAMLAPVGARAETVWACEQDGRIGGRASAVCQTSVEPGSYEIRIAGLNSEGSGELRLTIDEQRYATCTALASLWSCDDGTLGAGQAGLWPTFQIEAAEATTIHFRTYPPACGTVTCDREPQVIVGRFRIRVDAIA